MGDKVIDKQDCEDMLSAMLATRKMMQAKTGPFEEMSEGALETLLFVSNAEINLLAWVLGYGERNHDFITCGVCENCGGRGWIYDDVVNQYVQGPCSCQKEVRVGSN